MNNSNKIEGQSAAPAGAAETVISASAAAAASADRAIDVPKLELPKAATLDVASASTSPNVEQLKVAPLQLDAVKSPLTNPVGPAPSEAAAVAIAAAATAAIAPARASRFAVLAAAVALAAALGALAGALGASMLAGPAPAVAATTAPTEYAVHTVIEQMRTELAALRTGVEAGTRNANAQFGKITERFDRVERAQTERAAKLAKAFEAVDRLERRVDLAPAKETTGSVTPQQAAATPAAAPAHPAQPPTVPGWTLRDVYRGVALIQGARLGTIEVEAGDTVPYLGRIESIRRQDGHWVVVTSKGVIASAR